MEELLVALAALPDLIKLGHEIMTYLNKVSGDDAAGFIKKSGAAFSQLNSAKTHEERQNAAKALSDLISSL